MLTYVCLHFNGLQIMKKDHLHVSLKKSSCMFQFESFKVDPKLYVSKFSLVSPHVSTHVSYKLAH